MAKKPKRPVGRPKGDVILTPAMQMVLLSRIAQTGRVPGCWNGICKEETYRNFAAAHKPEWDKRVQLAKQEFATDAMLAAPKLRAALIKHLQDLITKGQETIDADGKSTWRKLSLGETIKAMDYLPKGRYQDFMDVLGENPFANAKPDTEETTA